MKALISPIEQPIYYVSSWTDTTPPQPRISIIQNSCRVAQVEPDTQIFPVGGDLFWTDCPDNCVADQWYYDTVAQTVNAIPNVPEPNKTTGTMPA